MRSGSHVEVIVEVVDLQVEPGDVIVIVEAGDDTVVVCSLVDTTVVVASAISKCQHQRICRSLPDLNDRYPPCPETVSVLVMVSCSVFVAYLKRRSS